MIILASAIILSLSNTDIFDKAQEAVDASDIKQIQAYAATVWAEAYLDGARTKEALEAAVTEGLKDIDTSKYAITVTEKGVAVYNFPDSWKNSITTIVDGVPIPKGFVASPYGANGDVKAENTKAGGLVIYELESTETVIPSTETQYESWTTRNQYVWVPVEDFSKFVRQNFGMNYSIVTNSLGTGYWEVVVDSSNMPLTTLAEHGASFMTQTTLSEVQAMYASVKKYGGFYIARYEASGNGTSIMGVTPANATDWSSAAYDFTVDTGGIVATARSKYTATGTTGVVSTLTYGVQWDATLQWWLDTGAMTKAELTENSAEHGNYEFFYEETEYERIEANLNQGAEYVEAGYGNGWILTTGGLKAANINNIYDMAGNVTEWTMEGCSWSHDYGASHARIARGGGYMR